MELSWMNGLERMEWNEMGWTGMDRTGVEWVTWMEWSGMEWNATERNGTEWNGGNEWNERMGWTGMDWNGPEWTGMNDWSGLDWTGKEWTGMEWLNESRIAGTFYQISQCWPHLPKVLGARHFFNILKWTSSSCYSPARRSMPATAETETLLRRPQEPLYPKNTGFRARECFHPWIHMLPNCYTSQAVDMMMMWLTWWDVNMMTRLPLDIRP